ncbi:hypothetical protein [Acuticoccus mangrovi]|uniref:Uncharacterized protein n=1 Tax=Acuticoccus mangrovi TaxID=2796142 RepID=A0A934IQW5_9HYPH|nr:hypothetical protein [Acuticoccus mangrovi]MBJ3778442.1 hypothetical protein [Acuticoccus mangrovi]
MAFCPTSRTSFSRTMRAQRMKGRYKALNALGRRGPAVERAKREAAARRLIFCITSGRSGSGALAALMAHVSAVQSVHEPEPKFAWMVRAVQRDRATAEEFLIYDKLPVVFAAVPEGGTYFEGHNGFGKGFFEAMDHLGVMPDLVMLRRDRRAVARSLLRMDWVPGRSRYGLQFLVGPDDPVLVPLPDWRRCSDYQLCYWHVLETEARQAAYAARARECGARILELTAERFREEDYLADKLAAFGIAVTVAERAALNAERGDRFNALPPVRSDDASEAEFAAAETSLLAALSRAGTRVGDEASVAEAVE